MKTLTQIGIANFVFFFFFKNRLKGGGHQILGNVILGSVGDQSIEMTTLGGGGKGENDR